jgi:hypothetical protein
MVEERPITVLLAKMFAEEMANAVEYNEDGPIVMRQLPDLSPNISEMMIRYIDELHRYETREGPELRRVHEDLRRIAWSCVEPTLVPGEVPYSVIEQELMNAGLERDAIAARLDYYAQGLGVLRYAAAGKETLRFALDPVAEYMAGLHLLDLFGGDEDLWRPFMERVERSVAESPNEDWSFLSALLSCCKAVGQRAGVSEEVITKLEKFTQVYLKAA